MADHQFTAATRRALLAGAGATGLLALAGCASIRHNALVGAIRKLLRQSADRALAKLTAPGGFWDSQVARFDLPELFGGRARLLQSLLTSPPFRERLREQLNRLAEQGARRAAPVLAEVVEKIGIDNAKALVAGGPTAATSYLRAQVGAGLINEMIPGLLDALRVARDPLIGQAIALLTGVDLGTVAQAVALKADSAIWYQIGAEEAAIRADPRSTGDAQLIEVFGHG